MPQMLGGQGSPALTLGSCAPAEAQFYQRAGFTVLDPGAPLPFPLGRPVWLGNTNPDYPCSFYRRW
jgi:hypothetical protein